MNDLHGAVWCFGDNLNTDVIHPPQYFSLDPEQVKQGLFRGIDPELHQRIRPGDMIVGGSNFGCGSSRETSIRSLKLNQVGAIVVIDFARIFFRNATNNGIPCLEAADPDALRRLRTGERVRLALDDWSLETPAGERIALRPPPSFVVRIWEAGGLLESLSLDPRPTH